MNIELLRAVCEAPGVPGYEEKIRGVIINRLKELSHAYSIDNLGNITVHVAGKSSEKRVMVAAHMDEIGFMVSHIDEKGFLRVHPLGGFDPKTLTAQRVVVHGKRDLIGVMGSKPIHMMSQDERNKVPQIKDYFIDLGLPKEEVESLVWVGVPVSRERELIEMGQCINCKSLDNRISVFILLEALERLDSPAYDWYAVFTVQEEVGLRGAHVSALQHAPDFAIALDTTIAYDVPGAGAHERVTELGKGTGIKLMDASAICDYRMVDFMKKQAAEHQIMWQPELLPAGGTDTAGLQRQVAGGSIAGAISIPTRHIHQVIEMVHRTDVEASIALLVACLQGLDGYDWAHR